MKSKFTKLLATALVLCLVLALLPAAAFAAGKYTITFKNDSGENFTDGKYNYGQIRVNNGDYNTEGYDENTEITLKAEPKPGYGLAVFEVTVGGEKQNVTNDTCTFTLTGNVVVKAAFRELHNVNVYADEESIQSIIVNPTTAAKDMTVNVTVTPKAGYSVSEIYYTKGNERETIATNSNTGSFTMPAGAVIVSAVATRIPTHTITVTQNMNGYVSTSPSGEVAEDTPVTVTARPFNGYEVEKIVYFKTGNASIAPVDITDNPQFNMPAYDVTVEATFKLATPDPDGHYVYYMDNLPGGSIFSDTGWASPGDIVTITATPDAGYKTVSVYYTANNYPYGIKEVATPIGNNKWTFEMPDYDVVVSARFEYDPYYPGTDYHYITVSNPGNHCSVNVPSGAYCGEDVTIKLSNFDTGYTLSYLKVDGVYVKPYAYNGYLAYTFKMPSHSVAIEVGTTSVSGKYYIDTSYDSTLGGVEVWVNNNYVGNNWHQGSWADYNDTVSFKVKPYYSDDVVSVSVVGKRTGWNYSYDYNSYSGWYTFTMPNEDVTINVDFRSGVHKVYVDKVTDGKLTVSDDWAKFGQIVYITAVPDYGCTLSSLSVRTATGDSVHVYNAQKADTYYFYMPDQYVSVSAVFTGKYTSVPFNDVSYGDWYYNAVQFVYSRGIMDGVDYYKFAPNGTITRGMILTMLWRMAGEPFEMPVTSFTDVEIGRYYTTAVAWACRNGIADGMGETKFGPNDAITREELVTLLYRYAQYFGHSCIGTSIEGFADAGSVSSYAYNAMCWAYKAGVVTGTTGSRLNPQGTASRAEAAQMIMSFYSFLNS